MASDQNMICPKCGAFQKKKETCEKCGVFVDKFQATEQETTQTRTQPVSSPTETSPQRKSMPIKIPIPAIVVVVVVVAAIFLLPEFVGDGENDFDEYMQEIPLFSVIKENDPIEYARLETILKNSIRKRESKGQVIARVQEFSAGLVKKYVPVASDDAVDDYSQYLLDMITEAKETNPGICYDLLYPKKYSKPEVLDYIEKHVNKNFLDAIGEVIKTASQNPQPLPDPKRSQELLNTLVEPIRSKFGDDLQLFAKTTHNSREKKKMCTMSIDIYKRILLLKKENASMLMRHLISQV